MKNICFSELYSRTKVYRVMTVLLDVGIVIQSHGVSPRMETNVGWLGLDGKLVETVVVTLGLKYEELPAIISTKCVGS